MSAQAEKKIRIALIGNPNTGKTTLFNNLTGLKQRTGNYPGVTVTKKVGTVRLKKSEAEIIDLPGTYSMSANSLDERVVLDVLNGRVAGMDIPDAVICIVDACSLRRNLLLVSQIATLGTPMILVLNQWDGLKKAGLEIDVPLLQKRLGIPVIKGIGTKGVGTEEIKNAIEETMKQPRLMNALNWPACVDEATEQLKNDLPESIQKKALLNNEVQRLLFDVVSSHVVSQNVDAAEMQKSIEQARQVMRKGGLNPIAAEAFLHYKHIDILLGGVIQKQGSSTASTSESIDRIMLHRGWGLVIFIGMMYLVFQSVYSWAGPIMDVIEMAKVAVQGIVSPGLESVPLVQSLVVDGVIEGVGAFLVFLPQILILFLFISLLEDTGYMARAAFLMDKMFSWCGLNGKSFVPLLSSYACAIPGIMATRTIEDPKTRLATIIVAPFMSCSARLPVYILMIGAFIEPTHGPLWAGFTLFAMHFVGLLIAVPTAWVLTRFVFKTNSQPFVMELPRYRVPRIRDVLWRMVESGIEFCKRAGTIIFAITIIIWALLYFPRLSDEKQASIGEQFMSSQAAQSITDEADWALKRDSLIASEQINNSYMGKIGRSIQPLFAPAGFDWKITVGVLSSFPAREVIISTLGIIYSLGGEVDEESGDLREALLSSTWKEGPNIGKPIFTIPVITGIMVFFALCSQCGATTAIIVKESGWKWALFSFFYMTALAWIGAVLCYQIGSRFI